MARPKLTPCPVCGTPPIEAPVTLHGEQIPPTIGDLAVCATCGSVMVYGADGFTVASEDQILSTADPELLARFRRFVAGRRFDLTDQDIAGIAARNPRERTDDEE